MRNLLAGNVEALEVLYGRRESTRKGSPHCRKCATELAMELQFSRMDRETGEELYHIRMICPHWRARLAGLAGNGHDRYWACIYADEYGGVRAEFDAEKNLRYI